MARDDRRCDYCGGKINGLGPTMLWNTISYLFCCVGHKLAFRKKLLRVLAG
jgi:hypothetical protein